MQIVMLLLFVSLILALGAVLLFGYSAFNRDIHRSEQISLLPLEDDQHAE